MHRVGSAGTSDILGQPASIPCLDLARGPVQVARPARNTPVPPTPSTRRRGERLRGSSTSGKALEESLVVGNRPSQMRVCCAITSATQTAIRIRFVAARDVTPARSEPLEERIRLIPFTRRNCSSPGLGVPVSRSRPGCGCRRSDRRRRWQRRAGQVEAAVSVRRPVRQGTRIRRSQPPITRRSNPGSHRPAARKRKNGRHRPTPAGQSLAFHSHARTCGWRPVSD